MNLLESIKDQLKKLSNLERRRVCQRGQNETFCLVALTMFVCFIFIMQSDCALPVQFTGPQAYKLFYTS